MGFRAAFCEAGCGCGFIYHGFAVYSLLSFFLFETSFFETSKMVICVSENTVTFFPPHNSDTTVWSRRGMYIHGRSESRKKSQHVYTRKKSFMIMSSNMIGNRQANTKETFLVGCTRTPGWLPFTTNGFAKQKQNSSTQNTSHVIPANKSRSQEVIQPCNKLKQRGHELHNPPH